MKSIRWEVVRDSIFLFGILTFSLPLKIPAVQSFLESGLQISFPIQLSTYTLFLPIWLGITVFIHLSRVSEVWRHLKIPLLLMVMLFVWMWMCAWFSEWRSHSMKHSGRYTIHLLVFLTLLLLVKAQNIRSMTAALLGWFLIVSGLTAAELLFPDWRLQPWFTSIGLKLEIHHSADRTRLSSLFENPNPYGVLSVSIMMITVGFIAENGWIYRIIGTLSGCAAFFGIIQSGSRNAFLTLIICGFIVSIFETLRKKIFKISSLRKIFFSSFLLIALGLLGLNWIPDNSLNERLYTSVNTVAAMDSINDLKNINPLRFELYGSVVDYLLANPSLSGPGPKTFEKMAEFSHLDDIIRYHAHNALLTIWVELGYVGLILSLGFLLHWLIRHQCSIFIFGGVLVLCIGQLLDYFIWQITFMTIQSLIFVLMAASAQLASNREK